MRLLLLFLCGSISALLQTSASAQLKLELSLERQNYISLEAIQATVTVTNNVGKNVVLGGPSETSWLNFQIKNTHGDPVSSLRPLPVAPLLLRNGESVKRTFSLDQHYYLSDTDNYIVSAAAYFPELQKYNVSSPVRFGVQPPRRTLWEEVFSVPESAGVPAGYRRFQIFIFNDVEKSYLYFSLLDEATKLVIHRAPLGTVVPDRDVQRIVDRNKRLNVIYQASPSIYTYQQIDAGASITATKYYLGSKGRPKLVNEPDGATAILGGMVFDPEAQKQADKDSFRKLSDRPANLSE